MEGCLFLQFLRELKYRQFQIMIIVLIFINLIIQVIREFYASQIVFNIKFSICYFFDADLSVSPSCTILQRYWMDWIIYVFRFDMTNLESMLLVNLISSSNCRINFIAVE